MMEIKIRGKNINLTPEVKTYVKERTDAFKPFVKQDSGALCEVELEKTTEHHKSGDIFRAEVKLSSKGNLYYAEANGQNLNAAIDEVKDEITRELRKNKEKRFAKFRKGAGAIKDMAKGFLRKR